VLSDYTGEVRARPPGAPVSRTGLPARTMRRVYRCLAMMAAAVSAITLPLAAAGPASADQVRQKQQWVLGALDVYPAWRVSQGRGVTVAVIDSGVDPTVSDLAGRVTSGPDLTSAGTPFSNPNWGMHGTWMASLIAGHGHGRAGADGILGVAPQARVLSIRVITDRTDPGYATYQAEPPSRGQLELARAIKFAVSRHVAVISMSLGYNAPSLPVRAALQYALNHNVVVVASSGNSGTAQTARGRGHAPYSFPADYPGVLGVAAISQSGAPAYFTSENLSVQVAAPGVNVPAQGRSSRYWLVSGTSPACALVAGVAALIKARYPKLTAAQVRRAITSSTRHRPAGGYNDEVGFGTVDAAAALAAAGRLGKEAPGGNSAAARAAAAGFFGNGPAGVPAVPVPPRGRRALVVFGAVAVACLLLVVASLWRFGIAMRGRKAAAGAHEATGPVSPPTSDPAPAALEGTPVEIRYAPQAFPDQVPPGGYVVQRPHGVGHPGPYAPTQAPGQPGQVFPGQPGQGFPGQPGQAYPVTRPAGHPGHSGADLRSNEYATQQGPGQVHRPATPLEPQPASQTRRHDGQGGPGFPGRPSQVQPGFGPGPGPLGAAHQGYGQHQAQPWPSQPSPGPGQPVQGQPVLGQPVQGQPVLGQPSPGQPVQGQPVLGQPSPGQPVQGQPVQGQARSWEPPQPSYGTAGGVSPPPGQAREGQPGRPAATTPRNSPVQPQPAVPKLPPVRFPKRAPAPADPVPTQQQAAEPSVSRRVTRAADQPAGRAAAAAEAAKDVPPMAKPASAKPGTDPPGTDRPGLVKPGTDKPGTVEPGLAAPGMDKPGLAAPGTAGLATSPASPATDGSAEPASGPGAGAGAAALAQPADRRQPLWDVWAAGEGGGRAGRRHQATQPPQPEGRVPPDDAT
jgi:hypothetical protein